MLAGECQWGNGRVVLLPSGNFESAPEAIDLVLEELAGAPLAISPPQWVQHVQIPGAAELEAEIDSAQQTIESLRSQIRSSEGKRDALLKYKRLIYSDGAELEEIVERALIYLGGSIIASKYGTEEYILVHHGREHLMEVKGAIGSAALKHVRQLIDNQLLAEETTGTAPHGILVVNGWRNDPPSERGKGTLIEFPDNVIQRASANDIALVSGAQILSAVCLKLKGDDDGSAFLNALTSTRGRLPRS